MQELRLGEMVRRKREELNISQEDLCRGICDRISLSRFETGRQSLSRKRVVALFQRLGLPDDRFYALLSEDELALEGAEREVRCIAVRLERAAEAERPALWALFREKLAALEALGPDDPFIRQCSLSVRAMQGTENGPYGFEERLGMLLEAIRLTVPRFDLDCVGMGPYSTEELRIIMQIAVTHSAAGRYEEAVGIYRMALEYLEANGQRLPQYSMLYSYFTYNYSAALCRMGCFQEALDMADEGWQTCVQSARYQVLAYLLSLQAECHFRLGNRTKSIELYHQAHYVLKATGDEYNLRLLDAEAKEWLNITFPF